MACTKLNAMADTNYSRETMKASEFETCLHSLVSKSVISSFAVFQQSTGEIIMKGGEAQDAETLSGLQQQHQITKIFNGDDIHDCPSVLLGDQKLILVHKTLCTFCAISERRKLGLVVGNLPANLVLAATFRRPAMAQQVMPEFERVCALVRV
jgi:hypothetical protein